MDNIPSKIYLQIGDDITPEEMKDIDFGDLREVSWASERIYPSDIEYVLATKAVKDMFTPPPSIDSYIRESAAAQPSK